MSDLFLTADELADLTGFKAPHCQARWLTRNRWRYVLTRRNAPRVARNHFNLNPAVTPSPAVSSRV